MSIQNNPNVGGLDPAPRGRSTRLDPSSRPVVRGLNRSVSVAAAGEQKTAVGKSVSHTQLKDRSISVDSGLARMEQTRQPQSLLSKQDVIAEAGIEKEKFGVKTSGGYGEILKLTDQCHKDTSGDYAGKLVRLNQLEDKVEKFVGAKMGKNKSLSADQSKRLSGLSKHLAGIKAEKQAVFKGLMTELNKPGVRQPEATALLHGLSVEALSNEVHGLDASVRGGVVSGLVQGLVGISRQEDAAPLAIDALKRGDISLATDEGRGIVNAVLQDASYDQLGGVAQQLYGEGALDAQVVMDVGPELIRRMNMDGIIDEQADADVTMGEIDSGLFTGTPLASAVSKKAISNGGLSAENQPVALMQQQAFVVSKLLSGNTDPAMKAMVCSWFQVGDINTIETYNSVLPDPRMEVDVSKPRFAAEIRKMDAKFFQDITSGRKFDPETKGWKKLPDNWQTQSGAEKITNQAVVHDYLARHAANLGVTNPAGGA